MDQSEYQQGQEIQEGDAPEGMPVPAQQPGVFTRLQNMSRSLVVMIAAGMAGGSMNEADTAQPRRSNFRVPPPQERAMRPTTRNIRSRRQAPTPSPTRIAVPQQAEENSTHVIQPDASVKELEKEILAAGYFTIDHSYDANNTREVAIRAKSLIEPIGYELTPVIISTSLQGAGHGEVLLPCPRDYIDQIHVGGAVKVFCNGKPVEFEAKVIYSGRGVRGDGYINPFVRVRLKEPNLRGHIFILTQHWVLRPQYPPFTEGQLIQKMRDPQAARAIREAAIAGASLEWNKEKGVDCKTKAQRAMREVNRAKKQYVVGTEGYDFDKPEDVKFKFTHFWCTASTSGGACIFDPRTLQDCYVGPQSRIVATGVPPYDILEWGGAPLDAANYGVYRIAGKPGQAGCSIPGHGEYGEGLKQVKPSHDVVRYAAALKEWRQKQIYGQNVAQGKN